MRATGPSQGLHCRRFAGHGEIGIVIVIVIVVVDADKVSSDENLGELGERGSLDGGRLV